MPTPPPPPLTHHEILGWVGPFTRRGRHVDLVATDRTLRRLVFKSIEHDVAAQDGTRLPGILESLQLERTPADGFRLTRVLTLANGLQASLQAEGAEAGDLLARIEAVPVQRQFVIGPAFEMAQSHRLGTDPVDSLRFTRGVARIGGLTLTLEPPTVRGMLAEVTLVAPDGEAPALPDDLFAVLGRDWSRLGEAAVGWRSGLRLRGGELARSRDAEAKMALAAGHLARTLAEPPACFHTRHRSARWWVYARRSVPLLACTLLVLAAASVPKLNLADNSPWRMLIFNAPPLLLILVFCLRELPRIEIPPWPRPSTALAWRGAPGAEGATGPAPKPAQK